MSNNITNFYKSVLLLQDLSQSVQNRIYQYGMKHNNYDLLSDLIKRDDLDKNIEEKLSHVSAVNVKVEWAKKKHRTNQELSDLIRNEKRVKVLSALASREDTPDVIYKAIAEHGKGQALEALLINNKVEQDIKSIAAKRYALSTNVKNSLKTVHHIILRNDPIVSDIIAQYSKSLHLGIAALTAAGSSAKEESINNILKLYSSYLDEFQSAHYNENYIAVSVAEELVTALKSSDYTNKTIIKECKNVLKNCKSKVNSQSYYSSKVDDAINDLDLIIIKEKSTVSIIDLAKNAKTDNDKKSLLERINKLRNVENSVYIAIARNENYTADEVYDILSDKYFGWYGNRALIYCLNLLPADKAAAIYLNSYQVGDDSILERFSNPYQLLHESIKLSIKKGNGNIHPGLIKSKYINKEIIKSLPLSIFRDQSVPLNITSELIEYMTSSLGDSESAWETVSVLGDQYDGSCYELIKLSKSL
jgi:hypothetical protein